MLGKVLGDRYELIEKIGCGGMAIVYKAKCRLLKRYVAVKILRPELVEDEEFIYRFKRESQAAASLSHHNIVNIYDVGQEGDIYYIVMEYIDGKTLKEYIREKKCLSHEETVKIAIQIASALAHAHKNNIVHRDIKPQNILLKADGTAKVTDFGIARAVTSSTITVAGANIVGSVHYFSPEQARGGYIDAKSDLYSLGIVMYEMATGVVPFEGDSVISVALKHIQEKVKPPGEFNPDIPRSLQDIIEKAIEKDQNKRYQSAEEMIQDLKRSLKEPDGDFVVKHFDSDEPTQILKPIELLDEVKNTEKALDEDAEDLGDNNKKRWLKGFLLVAPFIIIMLIALYVGNLIYKNNFGYEEVPVPNIEGFSQDEANKILRENNLFLEVRGSKNDNEIEEGYIISQEPKGGMYVKPHSTVKVVVSLGPELVEVPNVVGKPKRDAEIELENQGLTIGEPEYEYSEYPSGTVIRQSISPTTQVLKGEKIVLTISKGPEDNIVRVGNYVGQHLDMVSQLIQGDRLKMGEIKEEYSEEYSKGTVIRQNPAPGSTVSEYREIDLVVSAGPTPSYPKEIKIDLTGIENKKIVNIQVVKTQNGKQTEEYNRFHAVEEGEVTVRLEGKGSAKYDIYIDGTLYLSEVIDFTQRQKEEVG